MFAENFYTMRHILSGLKLTFVMLTMLGVSNEVKADFITVADLEYTCIGSNRYAVTLTVYSECGAAIGDLQDQLNFELFLRSDNLSVGVPITVLKPFSDAGEEVKIFCDQTVTNCTLGGTERGIKRFTYSVDIDLSQYGQSDDWILYWQQDFRSSFINTTSSGRVPYYTEVRINNVIGCNSSPTFEGSPILKGCIGEDNEYSLFPSDGNNNDLEFEFITPMQTTEATISYADGNTKDFPVDMTNPIQISTDGTITFLPTLNNQIGITDLLIKEFDDQGRLVGSVTKGIQISTYNCANAIPVISGLNNVDGALETSICVGETLNDVILGTDSDAGQDVDFEIVSATRNNVLQLSSGSSAQAVFNWTASNNDVGRHEFNLKLTDNGCPINQFTTETFIVNVNPLPTLDLGSDEFFNCDQPDVILSAISDFGTAPYEVSWVGWDFYELQPTDHYYKDTISHDDQLVVLDPGGYLILIEDANGCEFRDSVYYEIGMDANIVFSDKWCAGDSVKIENGTTVDTGTVVSANWDLDHNGATSTELDSLRYMYPDNESYTVQLIVENSLGCVDTTTREFQYCVLPTLSFIRTDSCEITTTYWTDTTIYETCDIRLREWFVNGVKVGEGVRVIDLQPDPVTFSYNMPDSGWYDITMRVHAFGGCETEVTQRLYYYPKPIIEFMEEDDVLTNFYLKCSEADTVLKIATLDTANGDLVYTWTTNLTVQNDTSLFANSTGFGINVVTDKIGCKDTADISISFPVAARFVYDTVCHDNVEMVFTNLSTVQTRLKDYLWEFGDGTTSSDVDPSHLFPERRNYSVELTVTDTNDCSNSTSLTVYNATILDSIYFTHDFSDTIVCAANDVNGQVGLEAPLGTNLTEISWTYGNITKTYGSGSVHGTAEQGRNVVFNFSSPGQDTIRTVVKFNAHSSVHSHFCTLEYEQPVEVFPFLGGVLRENRVCLGDVAEFQFFRDGNPSDSSVIDYTWTFKYRNSFNVLETLEESNESLGSLSLDTRINLSENANLDVSVTIKDTNGCWYSTSAVFAIIEIDQATIDYEPGCSNISIDMDVYHFNDQARVLNVMYVTDSLTEDTLFRFNAYDPDENRLLDAPPSGYEFLHSGENKIRVFIVSEGVDQYGLIKECRSVLDTSVLLFDVPILGFYADTVCARHFFTSFTDTTTIDSGSIEEYGWVFEDGSEQLTKDAQYILSSDGANTVRHYAVSDSGCIEEVTRAVYVHPTPDADFSFNPELAEAYTPLEFYNESNFYGTTPDSAWYEFGDGSHEDLDASYTSTSYVFDSVKVYYVTNAVSNELGCWDTIVKRTDLNVYLDLPNAFSPNNDLNNDELRLIYKGIVELYEFKIFNRWGELVFDAEGDLTASWDGTFRGADQEIGGYVAHVKALGAYDKEFNFKRDISLIR